MTAPALELTGLTAGYDRVPVVRDVSLRIEPGEVVALLGANGAGKTTTLLAISGLLPALAGEVQVLGSPIARRAHRTARRGLSHVPEGRGLFFSLTAEENLGVGLRGTRGARAAAQDRALSYFPALRPLLARQAGLLSGGEQQMLALARAIATEPKLLLVDEMSLGLAPVIVEELLPVIRSIAESTGCAVLLVEQHVQMALEVADRAFIMVHGRIELSGSAADLAHRRDLLESSYLGDSAFDAASTPD